MIARVRPPLPREIKEGQFEECIAIGAPQPNMKQQVFVSLDGQPVILRKDSQDMVQSAEGVEVYTFNRAFDWQSTQEDLFEEMIKYSIEQLLQGINSTIFAYGQTGSGKTYTMLGKPDKERGIIPRILDEIFHLIT